MGNVLPLPLVIAQHETQSQQVQIALALHSSPPQVSIVLDAMKLSISSHKKRKKVQTTKC